MDNYFTLPKVMTPLQEFMIVVVDTTRFCHWQPGKNVKKIDDRQINRNEIFWSVDSFGTLLLRCMENGLVLLATAVHTVIGVLTCCRRRPRVNQKNKIHMRKFWGKQGKVNVWIPKIVDDYNRRFQPKTSPFSTHDII